MQIFVINRKRLAALSAIAVLSGLFAATCATVTVAVNPKKIPIYSVERGDCKVSLTFNCAWGDEDIDQILDTLAKHNVRADFFLVGSWAEKYPDSAKKIVSGGHELGSHSYSHGHYLKMTRDEIFDDVAKCDKAIGDITGAPVRFVRGGYGEYNNDVLAVCEQTGHTYIQWSLDSLDYKAESAAEITERVMKKVQSGDIILMHTGTAHTAEALDGLISELLKNHSPVPLSELIYEENFEIDQSGRQHLCEKI